jgi:hypothetical protein
MNKVAAIQRINQKELDNGGTGINGSWHDEYKGSSIFSLSVVQRNPLTQIDV